MKNKTFYITTPIYYSSGNFHLGHCYTTVICDALSRFKRLEGYDTFYLTGTDEHGHKVEEMAKKAGKTPQAYVDVLYEQIIKLWDLLGIKYDKFIRTTDDYHVKAVQKIFKKLYEKGDLYKSEYEGLYCTPCEAFWTDAQLVDGKCPDCGREVKLAKEESYFFRLSKYQDRLIEHISNIPDFLLPQSRANEMINNFLKPGLKDLCVSRTSLKWGVPVTFDEKHVVYVWVDALSNYITALGYLGEDDSLFQKFWPADIHMVGKEIVRFHAIIWPAILMALEVPLPKKVYGHGWLLFEGDKMSKSKGNITDPFDLSANYGVDTLRYFLLRDVPFGSDGIYTNRAYLTRYNSDLVNDLGNLLSRTTAMLVQNFDGKLPANIEPEEIDNELVSMINGLYPTIVKDMDELKVQNALINIFQVVQRANKYIDETKPWILAKDESKKARLGTILYNLSETLRIVAVYLSAFLVNAPKEILNSFGEDLPNLFEGQVTFGKLKAGTKVVKTDTPLFPRINVEKELKAMEERLEKQVKTIENKDACSNPKADGNGKSVNNAPKDEEVKQIEEIDITDFAKVELKTGKIVACEKLPKSSKLLKSIVEIGDERRTILSGIAKFYSAEEMIEKEVVVVTNLKPAKIAGVLSEGMLLCAEDKQGNVVLLKPEKSMHSGSKIS